MHQTIPILPSRNLYTTEQFYQALGFHGQHFAPHYDYLIIRYEEVELHFFLHRTLDALNNDAGCYIRMNPSPVQTDPVSSWYSRWSKLSLPSQGVPRLVPPEVKPWGMYEMALVDPDGNLVRIGSVQNHD